MNWRENIEAQIASLRDGNYIEWTDGQLANYLQTLKDVAVAAEQHVAEWDDADANLQAALDKLREAE